MVCCVFAVEENERVFSNRNVDVIQGNSNEYPDEYLQKLSKPQLIAMALSQMDETKATVESLRDEVKAMNTNFMKRC